MTICVVKAPIRHSFRLGVLSNAVGQQPTEQAIALLNCSEKAKLQHSVAVTVGRKAWAGIEPRELPQATASRSRVSALRRQQHQMFVHGDKVRIELESSQKSSPGLSS